MHLADQRIKGKEGMGLRGPWAAVIAEDAETTSDKIHIVIPSFGRNLKWGPCRWQSRDAVSLPVRGDRALVLFDEGETPWIVAWWPFDEETVPVTSRVVEHDGALVRVLPDPPPIEPAENLTADFIVTAPLSLRRKIVTIAKAAWKLRDEYEYNQVRPMAAGIFSEDAHDKTDCSAYVILSYKAVGANDPSGNAFNGLGATWDLRDHGIWTSHPRAADLAMYGDSRTGDYPNGPTHVAIADGRGGVYSFGHTPIEYYKTVRYRDDFLGYITYPWLT